MPKYKLTYNDSVHVFDSDAFLLDGKNLSGQEYTILKMLISAKGSYIPKDEIANKLWNDDIDADKHNIKTPISQLRSKFGKDRKIIEGVKFKFGDQAGYHLDCIIEEINPLTTSIFAPYVNSNNTDEDVDSYTEYRIRKSDYQYFITKYNMKSATKKNIAIKGDGGIGKTTFAHILYNCMHNYYSSIGWVEYNQNLDETLLKSIVTKENEKREDKLNRISEYFGNSEKKLLIIDNIKDDPVNNQYPLKEKGSNYYFTLQKLKENYKNLDVIITTRFDHIPGYSSHELRDLDIATSFELFIYYYDSLDRIEDYDYEQVLLINKIVEKACNNILLIKSFAITAKNRYLGNLNELYDLIISDEFEDASLTEKIRELYAIEALPDNQKKLLWEFAILPNISLNCKDLQSILGIFPDNKDLHYLVDTGWISVNGLNGYSMHDVIKESILARCKTNTYTDFGIELSSILIYPSVDKIDDESLKYYYFCSKNKNGLAPEYCYQDIYLKQNYVDRIFSNGNLSTSEISKRIDILSSIIKYIKLNNKEMSYILFLISHYTYHNLGNKSRSEFLFREALICCTFANETKKYLSSDENKSYPYIIEELRINLFFELAYVLSSMGYNKLEEAYRLMNFTLGMHKPNNEYIDSQSEAFPDMMVAKEIEKKLDGFHFHLKGYNTLARILDHLGYITTISKPDLYDIAESDLKTALYIRSILYLFNSLRYVNTKKRNSILTPYRNFFKSVLIYLSFIKTHPESDITKNDPFTKAVIDNVQKYIDSRTDFSQWIDICCNLFSKKALDEIDVIESYFNYFSNSNYTKSLQDIATTEDNLGYLYVQMNRYSDASPYLLSALTNRIELEKREPKKHLSELSWTYNNIGELYLRMYEIERDNRLLNDAITNYSRAVDIRLELNTIFKDRYLDNLAWSYMGLWRCYLDKDDLTMAEECRKKSLVIYERLNTNSQYDADIKILNSEDPLSEPINWVGNQSHFKPNDTRKKRNDY